MNKIVREHYPVERLPEDLRVEFPNNAMVRLELVAEDELIFAPPAQAMTGAETAELIRTRLKANTGQKKNMQEIVAEIRALRDEWDD